MEGAPILYALIPIFNEAENFPGLLSSLIDLRERVRDEFTCCPIIVDDGSTDSTRVELLRNAGVLQAVVLSHETNLGPGAAFRTGFKYLDGKLEEGDCVVTMEGDNTFRLDALMHMLLRRREGYDVVLASAYAYGGGIRGVEAHRVLLSHCANGLAKFLLGLRGFHTLSSFFRLYNGDIIRRLQERFGSGILQFYGFECMVELLLKLVILRARISEVEMTLDWRGRKGKSKMKVFPAFAGYLRLLMAGRRWRKEADGNFWSPVTSGPSNE